MLADSEQLWALYQLVRHERWFAHKHVTPTGLWAVDSARFLDRSGAPLRWLMLRVEPEAKVYSLVVSECYPHAPALASPASLIEALCERGSAPTDRGGMLSCIADTALDDLRGLEPIEDGDSSNSLFIGEADHAPCVAKYYRKIDSSGLREHSTLAAMASAGFTPRLVGSIVYRAPGTPASTTPAMVCLLLERIAGTPAYRPFQSVARAGLEQLENRQAIALSRGSGDPPLAELCGMIGRGIAGFHAAAHGAAPKDQMAAPLRLARFADAVLDRWEQIVRLIERSPDAAAIQPWQAQRLSAALAALAADARANPHDLDPGFSHGDLHLSHVIFEPDCEHCRIIDPNHAIGQPAADDHSARDLLQIRRSLECFILDETASLLSEADGCTREKAAARLACPANSRDAHYIAFAAQWADEVFGGIVSAYRQRVPDRLMAPLTDQRWADLFYLDRLLHELEYDVSYGRTFFLNAGIAFLLRFAPAAEPELAGELPT